MSIHTNHLGAVELDHADFVLSRHVDDEEDPREPYIHAGMSPADRELDDFEYWISMHGFAHPRPAVIADELLPVSDGDCPF